MTTTDGPIPRLLRGRRSMSLTRALPARLASLLLMACSSAGVGAGAPASAQAGEEMFDEMWRAYSGVQTFEQHGRVTSVSVRGPKRDVSSTTFSVSFERPERIRFEFLVRADHGSVHGLLWSQESSAEILLFDHRKTTPSIADGAAELAGVSESSSWIASALAARRPDSAAATTHFQFLRDETVEGSMCHVLVRRESRSSNTLWIDQRTHWLRRRLLESDIQPKDGDTTPLRIKITTAFDEPTVNMPIDPSHLRGEL
jgi:hypothetical protein